MINRSSRIIRWIVSLRPPVYYLQRDRHVRSARSTRPIPLSLAAGRHSLPLTHSLALRRADN